MHLERVLERLKGEGLHLKPEKRKFDASQVDYLGHTLTAEGVKPNESKIVAVKEFPKPQSVKEVRTFLGLVNFYRRHVRNMATICRPLTALTQKDKKELVCSSECDEAFDKIKNLLVTAPLLHPPDLEKEFFLWKEAREKGFGAVLEQEGTDKIRHPVAYASRPTNNAEMKYAPTELEVAASVYALEHFQVYLLGNKVTVYTGHQVLVSSFLPYLKSQTKEILARWYLRLSPFLPNLTLQHKPGSTNKAADALSRSPVDSKQVSNVEFEIAGSTMKRIQESQREDPESLQLIEYLENNVLPDDRVMSKRIVSQSVKGYFVLDGILYYEDGLVPGRRRLVVPTQLKRQVLLDNHESLYAGHFAPKKLLQSQPVLLLAKDEHGCSSGI